jgi:hypothetical protein
MLIMLATGFCAASLAADSTDCWVGSVLVTAVMPVPESVLKVRSADDGPCANIEDHVASAEDEIRLPNHNLRSHPEIELEYFERVRSMIVLKRLSKKGPVLHIDPFLAVGRGNAGADEVSLQNGNLCSLPETKEKELRAQAFAFVESA